MGRLGRVCYLAGSETDGTGSNRRDSFALNGSDVAASLKTIFSCPRVLTRAGNTSGARVWADHVEKARA